MVAGGGCCIVDSLMIVAFEPLYTVDKTDLQLMHHDFDGVEVLPAVKAAGQVVPGIDGSIKAMTQRAGKRQFTVSAAGGKRKKFVDNLVYRDLVSQKRQLMIRKARRHFNFACVLFLCA